MLYCKLRTDVLQFSRIATERIKKIVDLLTMDTNRTVSLFGHCYRMDGKSALSMSSSSNVNTTNGTAIQSDFKDSNKKKPGCRETNNGGGGSLTTASRMKEKKKDNHATPMETSDEEAQSMDTIGKFR